jgi:hypothetical protein
MNRQSKLPALGAICCFAVVASQYAVAQQPVTTFDGVYDSTSTADPQNAIQCGAAGGAFAINVKNGQFPGPDRNVVTIGPDGAAEANGRLLMGGSLTLPFKSVYRFAATGVDSDLTVTRLSSGVCIYHRHGTKRH